jgi:hypothetical protein
VVLDGPGNGPLQTNLNLIQRTRGIQSTVHEMQTPKANRGYVTYMSIQQKKGEDPYRPGRGRHGEVPRKMKQSR